MLGGVSILQSHLVQYPYFFNDEADVQRGLLICMLTPKQETVKQLCMSIIVGKGIHGNL